MLIAVFFLVRGGLEQKFVVRRAGLFLESNHPLRQQSEQWVHGRFDGCARHLHATDRWSVRHGVGVLYVETQSRYRVPDI